MTILGIDLDQVTLRYVDGLREFIAEELGIDPNLAVDEMPAPSDYGFSNWKVLENKFVEMHTGAVDRGLYSALKSFEGASRTLWKLSDEGFHNRVITSRFVKHGQNSRVVSDTAASLDEHNIPYRDIMFIRNKPDVYADIYIDDAPKNIAAFKKAGRDFIIFDDSYNQGIAGPRAYTWDDVYRLVHEIAAKQGRFPYRLRKGLRDAARSIASIFSKN